MKIATLITALILSTSNFANTQKIGGDGTDELIQICNFIGGDGTDGEIGGDGTDGEIGGDGTDEENNNNDTEEKLICELINLDSKY